MIKTLILEQNDLILNKLYYFALLNVEEQTESIPSLFCFAVDCGGRVAICKV